MEVRLKAMLAEFRPAILWGVGAFIGLIVLINENFLIGLILFVGCTFMTKAALGQGAASNILILLKEVSSIAASKLGIASDSTSARVNEMDDETYERNLADAISYWTKGERHAAADKLERLLGVQSGEAEGWFLLGKWADTLSAPELLAGGEMPNVQRAIRSLERATKLHPQNAEAYALLSDVYRSVDFRHSLEVSRKASQLDPQYERTTKQLEEIVSGNWNMLAKTTMYRTNTMRSEPSEKMLLARWYFDDPVGSVVIKGCVDGSGTNKSLFGLIFDNEDPNFDVDSPIGTLQIEQPSNGMVSATAVRLKR